MPGAAAAKSSSSSSKSSSSSSSSSSDSDGGKDQQAKDEGEPQGQQVPAEEKPSGDVGAAHAPQESQELAAPDQQATEPGVSRELAQDMTDVVADGQEAAAASSSSSGSSDEGKEEDTAGDDAAPEEVEADVEAAQVFGPQLPSATSEAAAAADEAAVPVADTGYGGAAATGGDVEAGTAQAADSDVESSSSSSSSSNAAPEAAVESGADAAEALAEPSEANPRITRTTTVSLGMPVFDMPLEGEAATEAALAAQAAADVEAFLQSNVAVDPEAADRFRSLPPDVQRKVLERGDLSASRNPSAVLIARMRDAEKGEGPGQPAPPPPADGHPGVETMIATWNLDARAAGKLRALSSQKQDIAARLDLSVARNPSAFVVAALAKAPFVEDGPSLLATAPATLTVVS
jgi:hypothetical protein